MLAAIRIICRRAILAGFLVAYGGAAGLAHAQSSDTADRVAGTLGRGWTAYAAGQFAEAARFADEALAIDSRDHDAVSLKVRASSRIAVTAALEAYERWLALAGSEDVALLRVLARSVLAQMAASGDRGLQLQALTRLERGGDRTAGARLQELGSLADTGADFERALQGDGAAAMRLLEARNTTPVPPQALAAALPAAGPAAVPRLRELLKHPAGPVRGAAALALGRLDAQEARADLKPLFTDPATRTFASIALARLGDSDAEQVVQELLQSPVADLRLIAAEAYADRGPGPWVQALMPLLQDRNGLTRVRAAELLSAAAPEAAAATLAEAASDPNPVVRGDASRVLERTGSRLGSVESSCEPRTIAALRRLLRDSDPAVRLHAAGALTAVADRK